MPVVTQEEQAQIDVASRAIGTNALPFLLRWIQYDQPLWKANFLRFANAHMTWINSYYEDSARNRAGDAAEALPRLGPAAIPAIPELSRIFRNTNNPRYVRGNVYSCLLGLANASTNPETMLAVSNALLGIDPPLPTAIPRIKTRTAPR